MSVILTVDSLSKEFSGETLFSPFSFSLKEKDRMAIVGPNGTGKTTLLKMILGQEEISKGRIEISKGATIGYLSQDVIENPENSLYEEALLVFKDLIREQEEIENLSELISLNPNDEYLLREYSLKENHFLSQGGYDYKYKIAMILNMFSFSKEDYSRKISTFSGGEKTRLSFAKLLLRNPDLLILDEPTNHLDIISIEWLEDYLSSYQGTVLFVSHDVSFIRKLANRILDIENKTFTCYNCTYDNFLRQKKENYENLLSRYKREQEEREKLERFITYFMPKPRFASRAKDRVKKLERLEREAIDDPSKRKKRRLNMSLNGDVREGKRIFDFSDVSIGYDEALVEHIDFSLLGRDHLAVMGANGTGKSTLAKILIGEKRPLAGKIRKYFDLSIGMLRQDIVSYKEDRTLFQHFRDLYPRKSNQEIYDGLGSYSFTYEEVNEKKLSDLSGGELMRLELYQLSNESYDMIILDEPTNHLDMFSTSELVDTLNEYEGTLVIISHDRDFVDKTCDKILYLHNRKAYFFEGGYQEFRDNKLKGIMDEERKEISLVKEEKKETTKPASSPRTRRTRETSEKIMEKIERLEARKKELEECFYKEEYYTSSEKMALLNSEISDIDSKLSSLYEDLELSFS